MFWIHTMVAAHALASAVLIPVVVLLARKSRKNKTEWAFMAMLICLIVWLFCNSISKWLIFIYRIEIPLIPSVGGVASLGLGLAFYLVCEFLYEPRPARNRIYRLLAAAIGSLAVAPAFFMEQWIHHREVVDDLIVFYYGPLFPVTSAWIMILVLGGIALLIFRYRYIIRNDRQRTHIRLLIIGTFLSLLFVYVCSVFLPLMGNFFLDNIGPPTTLVLLSLLIYSILFHGLFDLRTFWLRLTLSGSVVVAGAVFLGLSVGYMLKSLGPEIAEFHTTMLILLSALGIVYGRFVEPGLRHRLFPSPPGVEDVISSLFHAERKISGEIHPALERILRALNRAIEFRNGFILCVDRNASLRLFHRGPVSTQARRILEQLFRRFRGPQPSDAAAMTYLDRTIVLEKGLDVPALADSEFRRRYPRLAQRMDQAFQFLQDEQFKLLVPLLYDGRWVGLIALGEKRDQSPYFHQEISLIEALRLSLALFLHNQIYYQDLEQRRKRAESEAERLSEYLADNRVHRKKLAEHTLIYRSPLMHAAIDSVQRASGSNRPVLVTGETGTGKELMARLIHDTDRPERPFVVVNCAAIPSHLLEDEIFGHVKGAFTDARSDRAGKALQAGDGTLFFDEIGEMPMELQAKLLRLLQDGTYSRLGENQTIRANCRFIFATNRDLRESIQEGIFREDLYYRINAFSIDLPPLRDRREDIPVLIDHLRMEMSAELGKEVPDIDGAAMQAMRLFPWPGNIRQLENVLLRTLAATDGPLIQVSDLPSEIVISSESGTALNAGPEVTAREEFVFDRPLGEMIEDFTRRVIQSALDQTDGNRTRAAEILGMGRTALLYRMKQLGLG